MLLKTMKVNEVCPNFPGPTAARLHRFKVSLQQID